MEIQYHPAPYPFIWNVSYSQGHEVLNKGHQNMFREVNDLWQTRDLKVAVEQLEKVRADFAALFAVEEKMMTQLLERQEQLKRSVIASKASSRRNRKLLDEGDESRTEDAAVPGAAVPGATVPGATEPVTSQDKIPRTLGGKVAFNDTHDQSPATSSASSSSLSTLGSDITPQRDRHYFYHSDNGEIIDLSTQALTVQRIQTHSTKHKLFLEDLEGIQRRLQFLLSGTAPKYVNDADFQGKREIQFISNWYIYHILSDDNSILYSFRLCQLLSGNREPGIVGIQYCNTRPKTNYRSLLETMSGVDLLSDDELNQLRNNKGFLIVRDWMAHLQQNFVVSICLIRPPSIQGSDFKIILSNVSWVEFSKVKPWFGCQKGYTQFFSAKNNLEITSILHDLKDANLPDGSYGIHKSQFIKGDNSHENVVCVLLPCVVVSSYFKSNSYYIISFMYHLSDGASLLNMDSSIFLSYAYRRQRSALLSGNYIGPLDDQICIQFQQGGTMPPHLGSQHMPVGNPAFDNLLQYLTVSLLQDDQWMAAELPGIKLTLRESDEGISVRERVLIKSLREALNAKTQVKDKQSLSLNLDQNNGLKTNRRNDNDDDNDDDDYDDDASTGRIHMNSTETAPQGTPVQSPHYIAPSPHEGGRSTAGRLLSAVSESNSNGQITDQFADDIGLKKFVQKKKKIKKHRRKRLFD